MRKRHEKKYIVTELQRKEKTKKKWRRKRVIETGNCDNKPQGK